MQIFMRQAVMTLMVVAVGQTGLARDTDCCWIADPGEAAIATDVPRAGTVARSPCDMEDSAFAVQCPSECGCENALRAAKQPCRTWYIDYRVQQMFDSNTSFQFGSSAPLTGPYTPIRAYNIDYHLQRGGDMHQMMSTGGGALHLALIADAPFNNHCSVGLQADHTEIRTTGTLRQVQDNKWSVSDYGVQVNSDQTSLTAYFRFCR